MEAPLHLEISVPRVGQRFVKVSGVRLFYRGTFGRPNDFVAPRVPI
jgi:hypothetical protein